MKIKPYQDTGWIESPGGRCITDYHRRMLFERPLEPNELADVAEYLATNNCPGWTGIHVSELGRAHYEFTTTWDSSD